MHPGLQHLEFRVANIGYESTLFGFHVHQLYFFNDKKRDLTNPQEFDNHDTIRTSTSCSFSPCFHCTFDQVLLI